jgi:plastocyanin
MRSAWWIRWRCSGRRLGFSSAMRRLGIAVVTAGAVAVALTAAGVAQDESRRHRVTIEGLRFTPADVVADPGDTVEWVNRDLVPHTVTARDDSWDSHGLAENATWEMHITDSTVGDYFCQYHPTMHGRLVIRRR